MPRIYDAGPSFILYCLTYILRGANVILAVLIIIESYNMEPFLY